VWFLGLWTCFSRMSWQRDNHDQRLWSFVSNGGGKLWWRSDVRDFGQWNEWVMIENECIWLNTHKWHKIIMWPADESRWVWWNSYKSSHTLFRIGKGCFNQCNLCGSYLLHWKVASYWINVLTSLVHSGQQKEATTRARLDLRPKWLVVGDSWDALS